MLFLSESIERFSLDSGFPTRGIALERAVSAAPLNDLAISLAFLLSPRILFLDPAYTSSLQSCILLFGWTFPRSGR